MSVLFADDHRATGIDLYVVEEDTDSLDSLQQRVDNQDVPVFFGDPVGDVAKRLLRKCDSRTIHCFGKLYDQAAAVQGEVQRNRCHSKMIGHLPFLLPVPR